MIILSSLKCYKIATPKLGKIKSRLEDISSTSSGLFEAEFDPTLLANESHFLRILHMEVCWIGQWVQNKQKK